MIGMSWSDWLLWFWFFLALVSIVAGWVWTIILYIAGGQYLKELAQRPLGHEENYLWVFLVPALNEGVTIADSVARLRAVNAAHKLVIVINDGSDDDTGEVLERIAGPDLEVHTRVLPNARKGKAVALNDAFAMVESKLATLPALRNWTPDQIIFGIVDADGRLDHDAPKFLACHFDNPQVGGVQLNVVIYNDTTWLTRMQALEFRVFGQLFQVGRARWGASFMGGNGQFNRMSALKSVASADGPWSEFLTEDQELGLRLLERGWLGEHEPRSFVAQQGLNSLSRLYRQRTRWMQGNLQVCAEIARVHSFYLLGRRRFDVLFTLLMPILQIVVGVAVVLSVVLAIGFGVPYLPLDEPLLMGYFVIMAFGPTTVSVLVQARGQDAHGRIAAIKATPNYLAYTWLMWPVVFRGVYSQLRGNKTWAKTAREKIAGTVETEDNPADETQDEASPSSS